MPKSPWLSGGYNLSSTSTNGFLFSWRGIPRWDQRVSAYPPHQSGLFEGEWKIGTPHHFGTNKHHIFWKAQSSRLMSRTVYNENLTPPPEENIISSHFWRFWGISGSQPSNFSFTNQGFQRLQPPYEPPQPWPFLHDVFEKPRHWEVALKAGPFTEVIIWKAEKIIGKMVGAPGFLKWWYPTTMGFPTKNDHFGLFWGYHHLRKHPYTPYIVGIYWVYPHLYPI